MTDLNGEGIGGVPALFKSFTAQAGLDYDVSLETRGGAGLEFHLESKLGAIGSRAWDKVVMHGQSTLDLDQAGRSRQADRDDAGRWRTFCAPQSEGRAVSDGDVVACRSDVSGQGRLVRQADRGDGARRPRRERQGGGGEPAIKAVIPVGEAWTRAIQTGVADANPYDGIEAGKVDLWTYDHYHASTSRLLPGGAGRVRRPHRPRSAVARRERVLGVRAGTAEAAGRCARAGRVRPTRRGGTRQHCPSAPPKPVGPERCITRR